MFLQSAEAALSELCGEIDAKFIGNAPCAFFKYKYPAASQEKEQCDGAKVKYRIETYPINQSFYTYELHTFSLQSLFCFY